MASLEAVLRRELASPCSVLPPGKPQVLSLCLLLRRRSSTSPLQLCDQEPRFALITEDVCACHASAAQCRGPLTIAAALLLSWLVRLLLTGYQRPSTIRGWLGASRKAYMLASPSMDAGVHGI